MYANWDIVYGRMYRFQIDGFANSGLGIALDPKDFSDPCDPLWRVNILLHHYFRCRTPKTFVPDRDVLLYGYYPSTRPDQHPVACFWRTEARYLTEVEG